jgi:hypothetical protein
MEETQSSIGVRDILFNALFAFVVFFILAFLLINPIAKTADVENNAQILITARWGDGRPEDVDLYVQDPLGNLVWFRSREAGFLTLDRDDLGERGDTLEVDGEQIKNPLNEETVAIRGVLVPGEYTVNVHLYRGVAGVVVPVTVKVERVNPKVQVIFFGTVTLPAQNSEITVVSFTVTAEDKVTGAVTVPKQLTPLRRR